MRFFTTGITSLLLATFLCSCVSAGKFKRTKLDYETRLAASADRVKQQQDSLLGLQFDLARSQGGNDMLLATQDKLQDRLAAQEDELDELKGNFSNASSRLSTELVKAKQEAARAREQRDSLKSQQGELVKEFSSGLDRGGEVIRKAIETILPTDAYRITVSGGELRISVQEDHLFAPRSVTRLNDEAEVVLRGVIDALQANPLLKLTIIGHTDNKPNPRRGTSNLEFGSLRATRLAEEMANAYYLSPNRVVAASSGEYNPMTSNETEEGRAKNRRVDFVLRNNVGNLLREMDRL